MSDSLKFVVSVAAGAAGLAFLVCTTSPDAKTERRTRSNSILERYAAMDHDVEARKNVAKYGLQRNYGGLTNMEQVFSAWIGWGPVPHSPCFKGVHSNFPGAVPGPIVLNRVKKVLFDLGFDDVNTLYGQSICPDEINNEKGDLADLFKDLWGEVFHLGGMSGVPFVGKTGFKAFSTHVPDGGNVFVLYGPHIAVSDTGEVGKYLRLGQSNHSTACAAVIAAYNSCCAGQHGAAHLDDMDLQQTWLREMLAPYCKNIGETPDPLAALAVTSFELVHQKLMEIVNTDFGSGKLVLLGGLQINMPAGNEDHFCPFSFEMRSAGKAPVNLLERTFGNTELQADVKSSNGGVLSINGSRSAEKAVEVSSHFFSWLGWAPSTGSACEKSLNCNFVGCLPSSVVLSRTRQCLEPLGFNAENTLYGQSICPDEINNQPGTLADLFKDFWGEVFPLGGIGAPPFVGKTGFGAFSAHIPKDGNIFILYGPHVAVSEEGEVGKHLRTGQDKSSTACGALIAAYNSCCSGKHGKEHKDPLDLQQNWLREQVLPHTTAIENAANPMAALARTAYEIVHKKMLSIVNTNFGKGNLVLLGGIQINTPFDFQDHFLPLNFEMRRAGQETVDLMDCFCLKELATQMQRTQHLM